MGLAMTPLLCVSPATGQTLASPAAGFPSSLPLLAEHRYRMLAKVRPLLFWISRDDVGGARIAWRGDQQGAVGFDLLIGSDPERAPRRVNKWGFISEEVRGSNARVLGVMKQSNEQSVREAEAQLGATGSTGYTFKAIQAVADARGASAQVTSIHADRDFTYRDAVPLLASVVQDKRSVVSPPVALPTNTRPGFLVALAELMNRGVEACHRQSGTLDRSTRARVTYVYDGAFYDMTTRDSQLLPTADIGGHRYTNVARSDFEVRSRKTGEITRFQVTYHTDGALVGVPVHAIYQPRWWLEVQLFLDDNATF
jgi:hypothetical protein